MTTYADLDHPIERSLLKHCRRIDPGTTIAQPREYEHAESLVDLGLLERVGQKGFSRSYRVTEAGRAVR